MNIYVIFLMVFINSFNAYSKTSAIERQNRSKRLTNSAIIAMKEGWPERALKQCEKSLYLDDKNIRCKNVIKRVTKERTDYYKNEFSRIIKRLREKKSRGDYLEPYESCSNIIKYLPDTLECEKIISNILNLEKEFSSTYEWRSKTKQSSKRTMLHNIYDFFSDKQKCIIAKHEIKYCKSRAVLESTDLEVLLKKEMEFLQEEDIVLAFHIRQYFVPSLYNSINQILEAGGGIPVCKIELKETVFNTEFPRTMQSVKVTEKLISVNGIDLKKIEGLQNEKCPNRK